MARPKSEPTHQTAFRIPVSLLARIDAHAARLRGDGLPVSRATVVVHLLTLALRAVESEGSAPAEARPGVVRAAVVPLHPTDVPETRSAAAR